MPHNKNLSPITSSGRGNGGLQKVTFATKPGIAQKADFPYRQPDKKPIPKILDDFIQTAGYHRT
jgi:hypothetical protein